MITIYYDILSPYAYIGLELFRKSTLYQKFEFELLPVTLGQILKITKNPGPNGIPQKQPNIIMDSCLQAKFFNLPIIGPPKHPFINFVPMRFLHCIEDQKLRYELALIINRACWGYGISIEMENDLINVLDKTNFWQEKWRNMDTFIKSKNGRKLVKSATNKALKNGIFGVPTFRYKTINFWGSDRVNLLEKFIENENYYRDNNFETMWNKIPT